MLLNHRRLSYAWRSMKNRTCGVDFSLWSWRNMAPDELTFHEDPAPNGPNGCKRRGSTSRKFKDPSSRCMWMMNLLICSDADIAWNLRRCIFRKLWQRQQSKTAYVSFRHTAPYLFWKGSHLWITWSSTTSDSCIKSCDPDHVDSRVEVERVQAEMSQYACLVSSESSAPPCCLAECEAILCWMTTGSYRNSAHP